MRTGVYEIVCLPTGRRYIGSTGWSFGKRWAKHRRDLEAGKHPSLVMQRAWRKYGAAAFEFRVLEHTTPEQAREREQVWIDRRKPVFNTNALATSSLGTKRTPEQRERYRAAALRRHAEGRGATQGLVQYVGSPEHRAWARQHAKNNQAKATAAAARSRAK